MNYGLLLEKSQKDNFREMCSRNINNFLEDNYIFLEYICCHTSKSKSVKANQPIQKSNWACLHVISGLSQIYFKINCC